jgi:hypothetical protein
MKRRGGLKELLHSEPPAVETAQSTANSASISAQLAANGITQLANGQYTGSTFINGTSISSPNITSGKITTSTLTGNIIEGNEIIGGTIEGVEFRGEKFDFTGGSGAMRLIGTGGIEWRNGSMILSAYNGVEIVNLYTGFTGDMINVY